MNDLSIKVILNVFFLMKIICWIKREYEINFVFKVIYKLKIIRG